MAIQPARSSPIVQTAFSVGAIISHPQGPLVLFGVGLPAVLAAEPFCDLFAAFRDPISGAQGNADVPRTPKTGRYSTEERYVKQFADNHPW